MKKLFGIFLMICALFCFNGKSMVVSANSINNNNETVESTMLEINNEAHSADLTGISSFAKFNDNVFYVKNGNLYSYNFNLKTEATLPYSNITKLKQANNKLFFLQDNKLVVLNSKGEVFTLNCPEITATNFNVFFNNDLTTISYFNNSTLNVIKFNESGEIINSISTNIEIDNVITMANSHDYTYVIYLDGSKNKFVKFNNNVNFDKLELTFTYLNSSNLEIINGDKPTFVLTYNHNSTLGFLTEQDGALVALNNVLVQGNKNPSFTLGEISNFTDVKYCDNQIMVACNSENSNIQAFNFENNNLVPNKIILASSGYDLGRFNNAEGIQAANINTIYVADTLNNRLQIITDKTSNAINSVDDLTFNNPKKVVSKDNINFFVLENNRVVCFNSDTSAHYTIDATNIYDIAITNNNEIYLSLTDGIYHAAAQSQLLTKVINGDFENSKLSYNNNNCLIVEKNNEVSIYNVTTLDKLFNDTITENIINLTYDYFGNVYVLTQNNITKIDNNNLTFTINSNKFNYDFSDVTCFDVNKVNGNIIYFNNKKQALFKIENNFVNNVNNVTPPINVNDNNLFTNMLPLGTIKTNCYTFDYDNSTNFNYKLLKNNNVYILKDFDQTNYYYAMFNNNNIINFGYVLKNNVEVTNYSFNPVTKVEAIYKNVKIYKYPTILKDNFNNRFIYTTINQNDVLNCVNKNIVSLDNSNYYAVLLDNNEIGYVNASDVRDVNTLDIKSLPDPNAKLINNNGGINLYSKEDVNSNILLELENNTLIYVENFDESKPLTQVTFVDSNKVAHVGYVETKYVIIQTSNPHLTSAFILLGVGIALTIAGIVVYVKFKKK